MKKQGPEYTFNVNKALEMRLLGWSYSAIGRHFHKDHTTILYHCVKFGIVPFKKPPVMPVIEFETPVSNPEKVYKYQYLFDQDGPINPGKPYKQYLEDAKKQQHSQWYRLYGTAYQDRNLTALTRQARKARGLPNPFDIKLVSDEL